MADSPFVGPSHALKGRLASVQRLVNMMAVPIEPGNERTSWRLVDVPGLVSAVPSPAPEPPPGPPPACAPIPGPYSFRDEFAAGDPLTPESIQGHAPDSSSATVGTWVKTGSGTATLDGSILKLYGNVAASVTRALQTATNGIGIGWRLNVGSPHARLFVNLGWAQITQSDDEIGIYFPLSESALTFSSSALADLAGKDMYIELPSTDVHKFYVCSTLVDTVSQTSERGSSTFTSVYLSNPTPVAADTWLDYLFFKVL